MRAYSSMTTTEFVAQLRDIAIKANARSAVIDQLDRLEDPSDLEKEHQEALVAEYDNGIDNGRSTQWETCFNAVEAVLRNRKGKFRHGITEAQFDIIMRALKQVEPQS